MGFGDYSHEAHQAIIQGRADLPQQRVFQQTQCHPLMNPKGVRLRESRDSAEHPEATAIVFALDVTGSMGEIPDMLARRELPQFMTLLGDCNVRHPQVLFVAVGDATSDQASLQVGQFETTAELMDQWLTWSFLEGGGGGQNHESYELAFYFLAEHTEMDCFVKRKRRGYLFMTGDELPYPAVSRHQVEALIGDRLDEDIPTPAVIARVQETFEPFFLIPDAKRRGQCERPWRDLLGDRVICLETPADTCYAAAGLVALAQGAVADLDGLARLLANGNSAVSRERMAAVIRALTPFAAALARDGAPIPALSGSSLPAGQGKSFWKRLLGG